MDGDSLHLYKPQPIVDTVQTHGVLNPQAKISKFEGKKQGHNPLPEIL